MTSGCAVCDVFRHCPSKRDAPDLKWAQCGNKHEFSDGSKETSVEDAHAKCFCMWVDLPCNDGRIATFCAPPVDNLDDLYLDAFSDLDVVSPTTDFVNSAIFDDGTIVGFEEGYAACRGFSECSVNSRGCSEGRAYLDCRTGGSTSTYIGFNQQVYGSSSAARDYCGAEF